MIKVENIEVQGIQQAILGMRNPMNSWKLSDSKLELSDTFDYRIYIGDKDLNLMQRLFKAGTEHRKYLRFIQCYMTIVAPLYWYKEFDTYTFVSSNSCSTMHKLASRDLTLDDFSHEHLHNGAETTLLCTIGALNLYRQKYMKALNSDDEEVRATAKEEWYKMIQLLPTSFNQKRTVCFNYETAANMIRQREGHKLNEWREFVDVLKDLPYMQAIRSDEK